jgi:glycosyltransferase involved in cell wall biosynthesis
MSGPFVTVGVPAYRGAEDIPATLDSLRSQTYPHLDVVISVDAGDMETARACEPFVKRDSRFRMTVQSSRLGWAGNTDWTMRQRRGEFYIFNQHDDQTTPDYVAALVEAALRFPEASICFTEMHTSGLRTLVQPGVALSGPPLDRATKYLEHLDHVPFRGLIRSSSLAKTAGLLLADFNPFDSFGSEIRLLTELALLGEFRFVQGPVYYKRLHGKNIHLTRNKFSDQQRLLAWACLGAWLIEVIVPVGQNEIERRDLFNKILNRFLALNDKWRRLRIPARALARSTSPTLEPFRSLLARLKKNERLAKVTSGRWMLYEPDDEEKRTALLRAMFDRLKSEGRFDPQADLRSDWKQLEADSFRRYASH